MIRASRAARPHGAGAPRTRTTPPRATERKTPMPPTTRRTFLARAALAAAGPLALARPARAIDPIGRTRPSHLKLSLAAYSYRDYLPHARNPKPRMDLFDFVNLCADMA